MTLGHYIREVVSCGGLSKLCFPLVMQSQSRNRNNDLEGVCFGVIQREI